MHHGSAPFGGPWLRRQPSLYCPGVVGLFSKLMRHEAGRCGKLLEHHEHRKKRTVARASVSRIALQGSQQRAPPTPDRAGVRRGSRFSGPLAKRQISVRLSVGFRAGGRAKKVGHGFTLRYQPSAQSQPTRARGTAKKEAKSCKGTWHMLTCRPGWFGGCGFLHGG